MSLTAYKKMQIEDYACMVSVRCALCEVWLKLEEHPLHSNGPVGELLIINIFS